MNSRTYTDLPEAARAVSIRYGNPRQRRLAVFLAALGMLLGVAGAWGGWKAYASFEPTARPFLQVGWQLSPLDLLDSPRNPRACLGNPPCREAFFHRWRQATPPLVGLPFEGPGLYLSLLAAGMGLTLLGLLLAKLLESEQIGLESTFSQAFGGVVLGVLGYSLPGLAGLAAPPWLESLLALAGLVLGVNARNRNRALYSALRARYADARELRRMTLTPANRARALPLARLSPDKPEPLIGSVPTPAKKELDHLLVVAPTRGGKGLHIRQTLWHWGGSAVVIDLKGDAYRETAVRREELGGRYFLLDPEGYGSCYDPFGEMVRDESVASAAQLIMVSEQDKDPIFAERASYLMEAFIYLAQYRQQPATGLMYGLMSRGEDAVYQEFKRLKSQPSREDRPRELLEKALARFNFFYGSEKDDKFRASCYGTFSTRARPLVSEGVRSMTQRSDFTARDLIERPTTLYIRLSEENLDFTKGIVQILISTLTGQLTRTIDREQGGYARVPLLFLFDEAKRIPMDFIPDPITQRVVDLGDLSRPFALVAPPEQKDRAEEYLRHNGVQIRQHLPPPVYGRLWLLGGQWRPSALQAAEAVLRGALAPLRLSEKLDIPTLARLEPPAEAYLHPPYPPERSLATWIGLLGYRPQVLWLDQPGGTAVLPHWRGPRISLMGRGPAEVPPAMQAALNQLRETLRG